MTFVELEKLVDGFLGDHAIAHGNDSNVILWPSVSENGLKAVASLLEDEKMFIHPCTEVVYLAEGSVLDLPILSHPLELGQSAPHWFPVCFCAYPHEA